MNIGDRIRWDELRCHACPEPATHVGIDEVAYLGALATLG
jgi:poly(3-hydroxybutyrate) depolymerase